LLNLDQRDNGQSNPSSVLLFVDDIVRKLKHLTSTIRLDYYRFMDDIERIQFFTAQQKEAGLRNYTPQTLVVNPFHVYFLFLIPEILLTYM